MSNRNQFEHRPGTHIISLREVAQEYSEPERLRLQLSAKVKKKPLDIGSLAYSIRGKNVSAKDDGGTPVVIESLIESRRELIVRLLGSFAGLRDTTVLTFYNRSESFIDWLNTKGYKDVFASEAQAQQAYRDYTAHLNHQIAHRGWKPATASILQGGAAKIIELVYPENSHHILAGAVRIKSVRGSSAASTAHVELYTDVCLAVAQQCSDFVLNNKPYPCVVNVRDYEVVVFRLFAFKGVADF